MSNNPLYVSFKESQELDVNGQPKGPKFFEAAVYNDNIEATIIFNCSFEDMKRRFHPQNLVLTLALMCTADEFNELKPSFTQYAFVGDDYNNPIGSSEIAFKDIDPDNEIFCTCCGKSFNVSCADEESFTYTEDNKLCCPSCAEKSIPTVN